MNKPYFWWNFFLIDWHHRCLANTIDLLLFYGEHVYGFSESVVTTFMRIKEHYYTKMLIGYKNIKLVSEEFPFAATSSEKNRPERFPFMATTDWIVLAVWWSVKYIFAPIIPWYSWKVSKKGSYVRTLWVLIGYLVLKVHPCKLKKYW